MIFFIIIDVLLIITELLSFLYNPKNHFSIKSIYNWLDLILFGSLILVVWDWIQNNDKFLMNFHFFGFFILSIRFLLEFRIFENFRHLTLMLLIVYYKIFEFITFFIGYLIIYSILDQINQINYLEYSERTPFNISFVKGFNIAFGNWEI